jgi:hypothetical protein
VNQGQQWLPLQLWQAIKQQQQQQALRQSLHCRMLMAFQRQTQGWMSPQLQGAAWMLVAQCSAVEPLAPQQSLTLHVVPQVLTHTTCSSSSSNSPPRGRQVCYRVSLLFRAGLGVMCVFVLFKSAAASKLKSSALKR